MGFLQFYLLNCPTSAITNFNILIGICSENFQLDQIQNLPDEVGRGVVASPRMSDRPAAVPRPDVRISFPEQNSGHPRMDFFNI